MVKLAIQIKAIGENVASILPNNEDFRWHVKLKNGGNETDKFIYICQSNQVDMKGSRGTANHCQKIGGKDCSVNILEDKIAAYNLPREDDGDDNDKIQLWQTIVAFECRGCEVSEFMFSDGWTVQGTDGGEYDDVDLSDDWYDVDNNGEPMSLTEIEYKIVKIK